MGNLPRTILRISCFILLTASSMAICARADGARADDYTLVPEEFINCTTCHGVELKGNQATDAPRIAGMEDWYLKSQLIAFKNGWRGTHELDLAGMEMRPQAAALSDDQIDSAAAFVQSVAPRSDSASPSISGNVSNGEALYTTCAACHGQRGEGNAMLNAPRLSGQSDWYLARQLEAYRESSRGFAEGDSSGAQMRAATAVLNNFGDAADVVAYINTL